MPQGEDATAADGRWSGFLKRPFPFWASLVVLVASLFLSTLDTPLQQRVRALSLDYLQRLHPRPYPAEFPLRVVAIDEKSLHRLGQWPWPRHRLAELVDRLRDMGARVVVFAMVFSEADRTSPAAIAQWWPEQPQIAALLDEAYDHDRVFADSLAKSQVVTGFMIDPQGTPGPLPLLQARFLTLGEQDARSFLEPSPGSGVVNLPLLQKVAAGSGVMSQQADADGILRRMALLRRLDSRIYPALGLESLRVFLQEKNLLVHVASTRGGGAPEAGIRAIEMGPLLLPTDPRGEVWLHYRPLNPDRYLSAADLLEGTVNAEKIAGHMVFVGITAKGAHATVHSPLGEILPLVELHVQLVEQLISGDALRRRPTWEMGVTALLLTFSWAFFYLLFSRLHPLWSVLVLPLLVAATFWFSWDRFVRHGLLFDPLYPSLCMLLLFLATIIPKHFETERQGRWIQEAFSRYVSPNRVAFLKAHPEQLQLGGVYRECSFVMTDLEGFTGLMEAHEPAHVVALLNRYLDGMIKIAFRHEGTVDRIVGDALAILFSTPVVQPDHPARALACALEMDRFAQAFQASQPEAAFGITRIGVHCGTVLVGNVGGATMLDYRAFGDAINTAARMEGANKYFGTRVCVSEAVVARCPEFVGRPLGEVILLGKKEWIRLFQPLSATEARGLPDYEWAYDCMAARSPEASRVWAELATRYPEDPVIAFHCKRLAAGESGIRVTLSGK